MNQPNEPKTHLFSPHTDQCIWFSWNYLGVFHWMD